MTLLTRLCLACMTLLLAMMITAPGCVILPYGGWEGLRVFVVFAFIAAVVGAWSAQWVVGLMTKPIRPRWRFSFAVGAVWSTLLYCLFATERYPRLRLPDSKPLWTTLFGVIVVTLLAALFVDINRSTDKAWSILVRFFVAVGFMMLIGFLWKVDAAPPVILALVCVFGASYLCSQRG